MGYELHITRKEEWFDEPNDKDISLQEWTAYVKSDPELRMDNFAEATTTNTNETIRVEKEGIAVWIPHSKLEDGGGWISYYKGNIEVKNPDKEFISKMKSIAYALHAKVVGDEGELY